METKMIIKMLKGMIVLKNYTVISKEPIEDFLLKHKG